MNGLKLWPDEPSYEGRKYEPKDDHTTGREDSLVTAACFTRVILTPWKAVSCFFDVVAVVDALVVRATGIFPDSYKMTVHQIN